jgi:hypothetical protein
VGSLHCLRGPGPGGLPNFFPPNWGSIWESLLRGWEGPTAKRL